MSEYDEETDSDSSSDEDSNRSWKTESEEEVDLSCSQAHALMQGEEVVVEEDVEEAKERKWVAQLSLQLTV